MVPKLLFSVVALGGSLCLSLPCDVPPDVATHQPGPRAGNSAVFRGPSGVIETMRAFLQALDAGDARMLDLLVGDDAAGDGYVVAPDETTKVGIKQVKAHRSNRFFEVSHDGKSLAAQGKRGFLQLLRKLVTGSKLDARTLETRFHTIRADCPSPWCSYAVVEFERTYSLGDAKLEPVLMRATALVRYVKRKDNRVPHFEIFHWHASAAKAAERKG